MNSKLSFLVLVLLIITNNAQAKEESFPFVASVLTNNLNIRAGQNTNFEVLCQLNKTDEALVLGKNFGWYKIKLPANCSSYIIAKYLQVMVSTGTLTADRVNVRAAAAYNATALGQVNRGDKVQILEKVKDWYKIVPVNESFGWVSEEYLKFKSNDVSSYHGPQLPKLLQSIPEAAVERKEDALPVQNAVVSITGELRKSDVNKEDGIFYKIETEDKKVYYISGFGGMLEQLVNNKVKVDGIILEKSFSKKFFPVMKIHKIQLII